MTYEIHPAATLFPMMSDEEFAGLKADIEENGLREPIVVWCDQVIDGRNRLKACEEIGVDPAFWELPDECDPWKFVISHNLHRRHLTSSQRAMVAAKLANILHGGDRLNESKIPIGTLVSMDDAAKQLNVGRTTVARAKSVTENGSEEVQSAVSSGELPVSLAAKLVKDVPNKEEQSAIVAQGAKAVRERVSTVSNTAIDSTEEEFSECDPPEPAPCKVSEFIRLWESCSPTAKRAIRLYLEDNDAN
jgi:hypothetical protein